MNLTLKRLYFKPDYTIGRLYIDDVYHCDTLEDTYRDLSLVEKVYGKTAIPFGTYKVILSISKRFGKLLPELLDVPQFTGIRVHSGNTVNDTEGCILVGLNKYRGQLIMSKYALDTLINKLENQNEININIAKGDI